MRKNDDITKWSPNVAMQTITHEDVMKIFLKNQLIGNWPLKCGFFARVAAGEWDRLKTRMPECNCLVRWHQQGIRPTSLRKETPTEYYYSEVAEIIAHGDFRFGCAQHGCSV